MGGKAREERKHTKWQVMSDEVTSDEIKRKF
jgi:hypothetical protein